MEIKGPGFKLRELYEDDAPALYKYANNTKISANLLDRMPSPYSRKDAEEFITLCKGQEPVTSFAIEINGEVAGMIGLEFRQDVYRKAPLIGYWLGEPYWGRGIITEAVKLVTRYAFGKFDIICIKAAIFSKNKPSMRVLEKAGYQLQGVIKGSVFKNGEILDEHVYATYND